MSEEASLYYKINVLESLRDIHPNPACIEPQLNKLLTQNYQQMMFKLDSEEAADSVNETHSEGHSISSFENAEN